MLMVLPVELSMFYTAVIRTRIVFACRLATCTAENTFYAADDAEFRFVSVGVLALDVNLEELFFAILRGAIDFASKQYRFSIRFTTL